MSKVYTDNIEKRTGGTAMAVPATGKWPTANIADDAITADKLANSINTDIAANTAKVTNATHTGDVTGATALTIAVDAVDIAMLSATGTADATTFLRGDNAWAAAGGDNTPAFAAYLGSTFTGMTNETWIKIPIDTEDFDTDSAFDKDTNYRFTVPAGEGGKYYIGGEIGIQNGNGDGEKAYISIYKNGSAYTFNETDSASGTVGTWERCLRNQHYIFTLAATDYVELYCYTRTQNGGGTAHIAGGSTRLTRFYGYKMIGI